MVRRPSPGHFMRQLPLLQGSSLVQSLLLPVHLRSRFLERISVVLLPVVILRSSCHSSLFDKMSALSKEVDEKFQKTVDEKMMTSTALPRWGDVCRLGDLPDFHKSPKVNKSFSRLLDKPVFLSLEDTTKLETCVRGLIESQSFSLWLIATMFKFLKDFNCVPDDSVFRQLIASVTTALNSLVKASFFGCSLFAAGAEGVICFPSSGLYPSFC